MNCIIIDDEEFARAIIEQFIKKNESLTLKAQFSNAIEAIKYLNENEVDLIFLDIHMPDFTGFDFIKTIKQTSKIVLTTSDKNFALEAFEYNSIVDYLVKPISIERFNKAVDKAFKFTLTNQPTQPFLSESGQPENENDLYVNINRRLIKIDIPSIKIIEAKGDYILIKTLEKNYTVHAPLKKIKDKLPEDIFVQTHRSFIINIKKIIDIEDNSVLIEKDIIPVSRSQRAELMRRLNLL